jgi:hypothetical protein
MAKAITREAAAAELDCSTRTIDRLIATGDLEAFRLGDDRNGGVRVTACSIDGLIERRLNAVRRQGSEGRSQPRSTGIDVGNVRASLRKARKKKADERSG